MKRFQEQLQKKSESIRLRARERADLRERVVAYMEYHPLPKEKTAERVNPTLIGAESYRTITVDVLSFGRYVGAFVVLFAIIVPIAAERAIPGDVLYPIKVSFNEEVRSTLALSPYQKVEWETARLERRIAEARLLASEGKLTPEVEAEVVEAVTAHNAAAQQEIALLRVTDGEEAAIAGIALTSALEVQSEFLEGQLNDGASSSTGHSVGALASVVDAARESAEEASSGEEISRERLLAHIEIETTRAFEFITTIEPVASPEERDDIERRLSDINTKIDDAAELADEEAIELLTLALSDTRKLISFMTNIEVREHVTVEKLVPVTLTDEEKRIRTSTHLEDAADVVVAMAEEMEELEAEVLEKVEFTLSEIDDLRASSTAATKVGELDEALRLAEMVLVLATDLEILIQRSTEIEAEDDTEAVPDEDEIASSTDAVLDVDTEDLETSTSTDAVATSTEEISAEEAPETDELIEVETTDTASSTEAS
ncbi:MAG: DUF5667 domain-containing protein [Bacteroidota bacterium]